MSSGKKPDSSFEDKIGEARDRQSLLGGKHI
jgi:hypothetical protein